MRLRMSTSLFVWPRLGWVRVFLIDFFTILRSHFCMLFHFCLLSLACVLAGPRSPAEAHEARIEVARWKRTKLTPSCQSREEGTSTQGATLNYTFRAMKYPREHPAFAGRALTAGFGPLELPRQPGSDEGKAER